MLSWSLWCAAAVPVISGRQDKAGYKETESLVKLDGVAITDASSLCVFRRAPAMIDSGRRQEAKLLVGHVSGSSWSCSDVKGSWQVRGLFVSLCASGLGCHSIVSNGNVPFSGCLAEEPEGGGCILPDEEEKVPAGQ